MSNSVKGKIHKSFSSRREGVCTLMVQYENSYRTTPYLQGGTRWRSWLRHCAKSWQVAGSILIVFIWIFHWHNPHHQTETYSCYWICYNKICVSTYCVIIAPKYSYTLFAPLQLLLRKCFINVLEKILEGNLPAPSLWHPPPSILRLWY